jgi:hypothetical protein
MKRQYLIGVVLSVAVVSLLLYWRQVAAPDSILTRESAIGLVKAKYPELVGYPSDGLPPRSIGSEDSSEGWYLAFIQNGSGRPILSARCFLVSDEGNVTPTGQYEPHSMPELLAISARTCQ